MIKKRYVAEYSDLPEAIQKDIDLVRSEMGMNSCAEFDVISEADRDEWLARVSDEYTKAHCNISDYFRLQGVPVGDNMLVLKWW